jgi:hypothetical protein
MFNDDPTREKIVLMAFPTGGNAAPAATVTNPAIKAYSMRSCPRVSLHRANRYRMVMAHGRAVWIAAHSDKTPVGSSSLSFSLPICAGWLVC